MGKLTKGVNDLKTLYPDIARQWHPTLNHPVQPDDVSAHSNKKYFWLCEKGHTYEATPDKRIRGDGCQYCSNRRFLPGYNDLKSMYPMLAEEWDYDNNIGLPEDYPVYSKENARWICSACGNRWEARIKDRVQSKYKLCPICSAAQKREEQHIAALKKTGGINDPLLLKEWDYKKNVKGPEEYTPMCMDYAFWICSKCGYHYKSKINNRTMGRGCACCAGKKVVQGVNDLATTHPHLAKEWHPTKNGDLKPTDVTYGRAKKVWWLCPEGHEYEAAINHRSTGTNCPVCNSGRQTSFAEQAVYFYVKKVFPDAISRYTDIFPKSMEVDIYIPSIKLAIEYDGEAWHKKDKQSRETRKYKICQENGIRLLRLMEKPPENGIILTADEGLSIEDGPMYEKKQLAKVIRFLLDEIDPETNKWSTIRPGFHSRVDINLDRDEAEIRKYMTAIKEGSFAELYPELAKEWHPTLNGQLTPDKVKPHSDIKAWWICPVCRKEYQTAVGHRTRGTGCPECGRLKSDQKRRKKVLMIDPDTRETIKTFDSVTEASEELGINKSNISSVCKGKREKAGGYMWRYAEKVTSETPVEEEKHE